MSGSSGKLPCETPSITLLASLSSRAPGLMSQSTSGRHFRRISAGARPSASPTMMTSTSFSKSSRHSLGGKPMAPTPSANVDRSRASLNDARSRTSTESSTERLAPSNLTATRPASAYQDSASTYDASLERSPSVPRRNRAPSRSSNTVFEPGSPPYRQRSPSRLGPPDSFRPAKHVFDQSAIRPRPWKEGGGGYGMEVTKSDASYCSSHTVPPEQADAYDCTERTVKEAIKAVAMVSMDVVAKILDSGILAYVPIPGLEAVTQVLVTTWNIVRAVSNNRLRLLRLTQRCAQYLMSIRQEVQDAGERVHSALQRALDALLGAFNKVRVLAETQKETPFLKRLLGRKEMEEQFATCDEELNNSLKLFSLSVQLNTMKLVLETTDKLRKQNEDLASQNQELLLLCSPRPQNQPSPSLVGQTLSACFSGASPSPPVTGSLDERMGIPMPMSSSASNLSAEMRGSRSITTTRPTFHRATASSRSKQVIPRRLSPEPRTSTQLTQISRTVASSSRRRDRSTDMSPSRRSRYDANPAGAGESPLNKIVEHQRVQNYFDRQCDMEDFKQLIKETLDAGKDSFIIKLLQIDVKDFPQAIVVLQHELEEYQRYGGRSALPSESAEIHQTFIQRGVDAMKRMTQSEEFECPEWAINKFKILELETIGYGSFSTVRRGSWNNQVVAIKILSPKTKSTVFENEMRIWKGLSHPNILPLFGASNSTEEPLFFVSLYAKHGNLVDFLHALRQHDLEGVFGDMLRDPNGSPGTDRRRHSRRYSNSLLREQAHHNRWYGSGSPSNADLDRLYTLPLSKSDSKFNRCHVLRDGDIFRFMLDIARGMEYLHENGVLHGDLKGSNILVNDDISCVISDFGQSERRTGIYRASGWTPKGTARWKAPELLNGAEGDLTTAVDVYAFAITCIEIMSMGSVPWGSMEDSILCHRIVVENLRPPIPQDFRNSALNELFDAWWDRDPGLRPEFKTIVDCVQDLIEDVEEGALEDIRRKTQRLSLSPQLVNSPEFPPVSEHLAMSFEQSPVAPASSPSGSYQETGKSYVPVWVSSNFSDLHLSPSSLEYEQFSSSTSNAMPTPMLPSPSIQNGSRGWEPIASPRYSQAPQFDSSLPTATTLGVGQPAESTSSTTVRPLKAHSPPEYDDDSEPSFVRVEFTTKERTPSVISVELKHEDLYQRVQHDFHWTLRIPLWNPVAVTVGDVGYMHPDTRSFTTLFNAFKPFHVPFESHISIPSILGFGDPILKHSRMATQKSRKLFRTFTYKLEMHEGEPLAHCFCESPDWHYLEETKPPEAWFKASVDSIIKIHGETHGIVREDLFLVVGALQASRYSLFVSYNHPTGVVEFTANTGKKGRPWGSFEIKENRKVSFDRSEQHMIASRISEVSGSPKALFLAALGFPPNANGPILV